MWEQTKEIILDLDSDLALNVIIDEEKISFNNYIRKLVKECMNDELGIQNEKQTKQRRGESC